MSFREYDLEDILWSILQVLGTIVAAAFMIGVVVLAIAGTIKCVQWMFAEPEEAAVMEENVG